MLLGPWDKSPTDSPIQLKFQRTLDDDFRKFTRHRRPHPHLDLHCPPLPVNNKLVQSNKLRNTTVEVVDWNRPQESSNLHLHLRGLHFSCWNFPRIVWLLRVKGYVLRAMFRGHDRDRRAPKGADSQEGLHRPGKIYEKPTTRLRFRRTLQVSSRKHLFPWICKQWKQKVRERTESHEGWITPTNEQIITTNPTRRHLPCFFVVAHLDVQIGVLLPRSET